MEIFITVSIMGLIKDLIIKVISITGLMMEIFITPFPFMGFNFPFMLDPLVFVCMYIYDQLLRLVAT